MGNSSCSTIGVDTNHEHCDRLEGISLHRRVSQRLAELPKPSGGAWPTRARWSGSGKVVPPTARLCLPTPSGSISTARPATRKSTTRRGRWRKSDLRCWPHGHHQRRKKPRRPLSGASTAAQRDSHKLRIWNVGLFQDAAGTARLIAGFVYKSIIMCELLHKCLYAASIRLGGSSKHPAPVFHHVHRPSASSAGSRSVKSRGFNDAQPYHHSDFMSGCVGTSLSAAGFGPDNT